MTVLLSQTITFCLPRMSSSARYAAIWIDVKSLVADAVTVVRR
jgi:hypothetical protein